MGNIVKTSNHNLSTGYHFLYVFDYFSVLLFRLSQHDTKTEIPIPCKKYCDVRGHSFCKYCTYAQRWLMIKTETCSGAIHSRTLTKWAGMVQSVYRLATGRTVWGSYSGEGEIVRTHPDRPSALPASYSMSIASLLRVKGPRRGVANPPSIQRRRVELYLSLGLLGLFQGEFYFCSY